jgi:hypothetical protein
LIYTAQVKNIGCLLKSKMTVSAGWIHIIAAENGNTALLHV